MRFTTATSIINTFLICGLGTNLAAAKIWIQFCDDTGCSENCGMSVSVNDPGCLAREWGRRSLKVHGQDFLGAYMVHSPGPDCDCQNDCTAIPGQGPPDCMDISDTAVAQSYRFQLTTCKEIEGGPGIGNNCGPQPTGNGGPPRAWANGTGVY